MARCLTTNLVQYVTINKIVSSFSYMKRSRRIIRTLSSSTVVVLKLDFKYYCNTVACSFAAGASARCACWRELLSGHLALCRERPPLASRSYLVSGSVCRRCCSSANGNKTIRAGKCGHIVSLYFLLRHLWRSD